MVRGRRAPVAIASRRLWRCGVRLAIGGRRTLGGRGGGGCVFQWCERRVAFACARCTGTGARARRHLGPHDVPTTTPHARAPRAGATAAASCLALAGVTRTPGFATDADAADTADVAATVGAASGRHQRRGFGRRRLFLLPYNRLHLLPPPAPLLLLLRLALTLRLRFEPGPVLQRAACPDPRANRVDRVARFAALALFLVVAIAIADVATTAVCALLRRRDAGEALQQRRQLGAKPTQELVQDGSRRAARLRRLVRELEPLA